MNFVMLVGLPGSGKSTLAIDYTLQGYTIISPDVIRNELNMHSLDQTQEVFDILHNRLIDCLKSGLDIVYDSTNLTRKRRLKVLELLKDYDYHTTCRTLIVPINVCKERNAKRVGYSKVTESEYKNMIEVFSLPMSDEGWDKLIVDNYDPAIIINDLTKTI